MNMKKLRKTCKEVKSHERRKIQQLDARGADEFAKKELGEENYRKQYRSNLSKINAFFDELTLKPPHIACLQKTPFYNFLEPFINKRVDANHIKGTQKGLVKFLVTYNRNEQVFVMGGQKLSISPKEFDLIFGIPSGSKEVDMNPCPVYESSLGRRRFLTRKRVTAVDIYNELLQCIEGTTRSDIEDTVRLIILHIVGCVLFVASADIARGWMFKMCDKLDELRDYDWGKAVVEYLTNYLNNKDAKDVKGCTAFLQYWFCERTTLIRPTKSVAFPRFLRWDLTQMKEAVEKIGVKDLGARQVRGRPITPTASESLALSTTSVSPQRKTRGSGSAIRSKQTKAKSPKQVAMVDGAVEADGEFVTPDFHKNDDSNIDFDEVPISRLDFSNVGLNEVKEPSHDESDKGTGKGKAVMTYEIELEEREKSLRSKERILQNREHAVDIRLAKLEHRVLEAGNEAQKWKRMYEDQAEVIRKLEVERDNAQANEAIRIITIGELNDQIKELQAKINEQGTGAAVAPLLHSTSPMMHPEPSFSIGLTQMDVDECEGKSVDQITDVEQHNTIPTDMVAKHTRSKLEVASPPPNSAIGKIGKNLVKYGPFKELSVEHQGTVEFLAGKVELKGCILWWDKEQQIRVKHSDILACIQRQSLSNDVLDAYCRIKLIDQGNGVFKTADSNRLSGTTLVFDALLLNEIRATETGRFVPPGNMLDHRYLIFPIFHKQNNTRRGVDHWTVLVMDREMGELRFYNSLRPRSGMKDPYLEDAMEVKRAIGRTTRYYSIPLPWDAPIIEDANAPQQSSNSVDCGVVVLFVITRYFEQKPVFKSVAPAELVAMRARIVETLLGWGDGKPYFADQLRKKRRIAK